MNLQQSIRKVLREDVSNRAQEKLNQVLKSLGVVSASKVVGSFSNLSKVLNLDLNDLKTQEMLVKSFIYFYDLKDEDITIDSLEVRTAASGGKVIKVNGTVTHDWENYNYWYEGHICDKLNDFFRLKLKLLVTLFLPVEVLKYS